MDIFTNICKKCGHIEAGHKALQMFSDGEPVPKYNTKCNVEGCTCDKFQPADYRKAKFEAQRLLGKFDVCDPIVPVFEIAKREGLQIVYFTPEDKLNDVSGFFDPKTNTIYINKSDSPQRQHFTIAHELGHFILKHESNKYGVLPRFATPIDKNPIEQEANCFAANLLVPEEMLKQTMEIYHLSKDDVESLSRLFGVSYDVIKYRLRWLN